MELLFGTSWLRLYGKEQLRGHSFCSASVEPADACHYMSHTGSWKVFLGHIGILTAQL